MKQKMARRCSASIVPTSSSTPMSKSPSPLRIYSIEMAPTKSSYRVLTDANLIVDYHIFWSVPLFENIKELSRNTYAFRVMVMPNSGTYKSSIVEVAHAVLHACVCSLQSEGIITDEEAGLAIIRLDALKDKANVEKSKSA
jgi:hypothetical protein